MTAQRTAAPFLIGTVIGTAVVAGLTGAGRWMRYWGVTDDDLRRALPGDDIVPRPDWAMTLATVVDAPPGMVWPWLAQIGYQRGGLYSYDWLDRIFGILDRPSADEILPEFQHLQAGDVIPIGAGPSWPVALAEPNHALVLAPDPPGMMVSWAFVLEPFGDGATRLVTRSRASATRTPLSPLYWRALDPIAFLMTRRMLLGIRDRAERLDRIPTTVPA